MEPAKVKFVCPCCGYPELEVPPYANMGLPPWEDHGSPPYYQRYGKASYDVCPCCAYEFGYDDEPMHPENARSFAKYLADWTAGGCHWLGHRVAPEGWSLEEQLRAASIPYPKPNS